MAENDTKIIFTGSVGTSVKTALRTMSGEPHSSGTSTTMAQAILKIGADKNIKLYGVLEQQQLDFTDDMLRSGCIGLVLLIDNTAENAISDLKSFLNTWREFINETNLAVGVTHMDLAKTTTLEDYRIELKAMSLNPPLFEVNIRHKKDVLLLVRALLCTA